MEIKKGISQMAEYPNREINYVVPADGKMYYVLNNGELKNGCIIATLDPKRAIDDQIECSSIGVFKEDGSVLIDFNKKDIKTINDDLLLVVNSTPVSTEVVNAQQKVNDTMFQNVMKENQITIVDSMMREMGITGEMLFSDAYGEAAVYKMDSYNNKIGVEASFIGKNDKELFFHTNDINSLVTKINYLDTNVPSEELNKEEEKKEDAADQSENKEEIEDISTDSFKLDISSDILDGFKKSEDTKASTDSYDVPEQKEEKKTEDKEKSNDEDEKHTFESNDIKDKVLDNAIEVVKKMIEETSKLNEKIIELEKELEEKTKELNELNEKISAQETKKNELNSLLTEASEVLDKID